MQKTPLLISFTIALLLTIYIALYELPRPTDVDIFSKYILNFNSKDLKEIVIKTKEQSEIVLNYDNKVWKITKPLTCRANQELITTIASLLPKLPKSNHINKKDLRPLSEYGLQTPNLSVTIFYRDANTDIDVKRIIDFGAFTGNKNEIYIKADQDPYVYLMHSQVAIQLAKNVDHFRDNNLINEQPDHLTMIKMETPEENWSLSKSNLTWQITEPYTWKANDETVLQLLKNLTSLKITRFAENDLSKKEQYGLNQPLIKIQYTSQENLATTLYIGATRAGSTFIQNTNENFIYAVDSAELLKCILNLQQLKDFALITTKSPEFVQLDYNQGKDTITFQKNIKQAWMVNKSNRPLNQQSVSALMEQISVLIPEYFVDGNLNDPLFGLQNEAVTVNIINLKGQKETIKIGKQTSGFVIPNQLKYFITIESAKQYAALKKIKENEIQELKNQYYATYQNFTQIFTIDEDVVKRLKLPLIKFEPHEFPEVDINAVYTVTRIINGQTEHFQRFGSNINWEVTSPEKAKIDSKEIALFIFVLCYFKVEDWVKEGLTQEELKNYGLANPMLQIELTFKDLSDTIKSGHYKYLFSKKIDGVYYGCCFVNINNQEYMLVPKLFTVSEKTITERLLKKLY